MPKLAPVSYRDLVNRLHRLGFEGPYEGGKHPVMARGSLRIRVPNPHGHDIGVDLLKRVLRQADISRQEWESVS